MDSTVDAPLGPDSLPDVVIIAIPCFLAAMFIESILAWRTRRASYELRDTIASVAMGSGNMFAGLIGAGSIYALHLWLWDHRLIDGLDFSVTGLIVAFLLQDLMYYWFHRMAHTRRWIWAGHVNHHSSQHCNLSTGLRQSWSSVFGLNWAFYLPISLFGVHPNIMFFCEGINLVYQFWIHTEAIRKMPWWFEAVMNTPSHHRAHHGTNARYLDANYGGILIIWDRLFGTFAPELASEPPRYGIIKNLGTFNPVRIAFHEWWAMCRDLAGARSVREVLGYTWGPPGWRPDGSGRTSAAIKAEWRALQKQRGQTR